MIDCNATECYNYSKRRRICKLEVTKIRVNTGGMSKEQYSADCTDFITRKQRRAMKGG